MGCLFNFSSLVGLAAAWSEGQGQKMFDLLSLFPYFFIFYWTPLKKRPAATTQAEMDGPLGPELKTDKIKSRHL